MTLQLIVFSVLLGGAPEHLVKLPAWTPAEAIEHCGKPDADHHYSANTRQLIYRSQNMELVFGKADGSSPWLLSEIADAADHDLPGNGWNDGIREAGKRLPCLAVIEPASTPITTRDDSDIVRSLAIGLGALLVLSIYFAPAIVAGNRHHRNTAAIFVLNVFLGWTFIGWVIALVWSQTDNVAQSAAA